jgi:hypothetical protein
MARQSDGLVVAWSSPSSGTGYYWTSLDDGATWTQSPNLLSTSPTRVATDGDRILFNTDGIRAFRTDDLFVTSDVVSGFDVTYAMFYGASVFMGKGIDRIWNLGDGTSRAQVLTGNFGGASSNNLTEGGGFWLATETDGADEIILRSNDGGLTFSEVGRVLNASATPSLVVTKDAE